mgnify:FL=1|tara:strand:+ start:3418 stop:4353 length:936 start_codon:yes stop_codon:yes gene_type:complete
MNPENLAETIKKSRPNIKDSTIKMYVGNLNKIKKIFESDDFKFLKNIDDVKEKLSEKHYTTQRNYYNSIIILLMALDSDKELIDEYNKIRDELNALYTANQKDGVISAKQKEAFISIDELKDFIDKIRIDLDITKLKKKDTATEKEKKLLMVYTILSILIENPMRNDLSQMKIIGKKGYNGLTDTEKRDTNYLVMEKSSLMFLLNDYKTSKKYLEKTIKISKPLEKIIRMYMRINKLKNGDVLFPISRNGISQLLIKTSKKYIQKSISTTMIRKIVASDLLKDVKEMEKKLSNKMGTDIDTIKDVYVKTSS